LKNSNPAWTTSEKDHPFVECVTFADNIKSKGGNYQSNWHFVDTPFYDGQGSFNITEDPHNATDAISNIVSWIKKDGDYQNSYEYQ